MRRYHLHHDFRLMEFDFERTLGEIRRVLAAETSVAGGMRRMLDYCAAQYPHQVWTSLERLEFQQNAERVHEWFAQVLAQQPIPPRIRGLWFGLCNPHQQGRPTCMLYLAGSAEFDAADPRARWVIEADYFPRRKETLWMAPSECLQEIHHKAYAKMYHTGNAPEYGTLCDYTLCLAFAGLCVRELFTRIPAADWLGGAPSRGVAAGFDDGDFLLLGKFDAAGFHDLLDGPFQ